MASAETFDEPARPRGRLVLAVFLWTVCLVLWCRPAVAAPSGWTTCAGELAYCELSGLDVYLTFGAGESACDISAGTCSGTYSAPIRFPTGFSGTCTASVFGGGDPAPGVPKTCFWVATAGEPSGGGASSPSGGTAFNPFNMPAEDGLIISSFIITVWGAAYAWKMAKRALDAADE